MARAPRHEDDERADRRCAHGVQCGRGLDRGQGEHARTRDLRPRLAASPRHAAEQRDDRRDRRGGREIEREQHLRRRRDRPSGCLVIGASGCFHGPRSCRAEVLHPGAAVAAAPPFKRVCRARAVAPAIFGRVVSARSEMISTSAASRGERYERHASSWRPAPVDRHRLRDDACGVTRANHTPLLRSTTSRQRAPPPCWRIARPLTRRSTARHPAPGRCGCRSPDRTSPSAAGCGARSCPP